MPLGIQAIVCAVDLSAFSPLVVAHGAALARRAGVRLHLIHAVHHPQDDLHPSVIFERGGELAALVERAKGRMAELMAGADLEWEAVVCFGEPVAEIAARVHQLPPCLVVSASHGVSGFRRLFIGTVVERLTRVLRRPMLVVRPGDAGGQGDPEGFASVVVGCDAHGHWRQVVPLLHLLQPHPAAEIHLVHAMEGPLDEGPPETGAAEVPPAPYDRAQQVHGERIRRQLAEGARHQLVRPSAARLSIAVTPGVPQEMVLGAARERGARLVVVGVRPSGKVGRWIAGSTTEALLRRSPCAVLTLPEPSKGEGGRGGVTLPAPGGPVTGVVWDPVYLEHLTDAGHPEHPRRLEPLYQRLTDPTIMGRYAAIAPTAATDEEILLAHSPAYLAQVKASADFSASALSGDTLTCDQSFRVAAQAVGGTLQAIRQVVAGRLSHALVLSRPPGHHAERTRAMGYCIFNNVAIGARYARSSLGLARVLVVDWDLHHGNGTQHQFERDPAVFFFSSHQFPHFPGTGHFTEIGLGPGEGTCMNVPLSKGCGDAEFAAIYRRLLVPVAASFRPDLILVSAGFDIHAKDPLGAMGVTPTGFAALTRLVLEMARQACAGRVVFCLEGGYHAEALADSVLAMLDELSGRRLTDVGALAAGADARLVDGVVARCRHIHRRFFDADGG